MDDTRLRPSLAVRASASEDGLILLDVDGGLVLASNAVGARIWQLIEQRGTPDQIARQLAEECAISVDRASQDVRAFVANLVERGLVSEERCE
jgi:Coenzyme PQQ synthesis protein D (PqqD)